MGIKKKSKVSAEFSMSSLTDIIFLLLIFFMLTSSLIIPNALNLKLPGKSRVPPTVTQRPTNISISSGGTYYINGKKLNLASLDKAIKQIKNQGRDVSITIAPHPKVANEHVVAVLDIAFRYRVETVLTEYR